MCRTRMITMARLKEQWKQRHCSSTNTNRKCRNLDTQDPRTQSRMTSIAKQCKLTSAPTSFQPPAGQPPPRTIRPPGPGKSSSSARPPERVESESQKKLQAVRFFHGFHFHGFGFPWSPWAEIAVLRRGKNRATGSASGVHVTHANHTTQPRHISGSDDKLLGLILGASKYVSPQLDEPTSHGDAVVVARGISTWTSGPSELSVEHILLAGG